MDSSNLSFCSLIKLFILASALHIASSIQLEDVAETCSGNLFITMNYKADWEKPEPETALAQTFYIPFASKAFAFHMMQNIFHAQKFDHLTETHLENSCLSWKKVDGYNWDHTNVTSYEDKTFSMHMVKTEVPKLFRFQFPYPSGGQSGYASISLSDNKGYNVFDFCFDNGLRTFAVLTVDPFLDEISFEVIKAHVKALGFKEKNFLTIYFPCDTTLDGIDAPKPALPTTLSILNLKHTKVLVSANSIFPSFFFEKKK
ncbi:hypothetical protein Ocin01_16442 [Orchesella cincta]|uniref:Uncharacterized protein n=1 Tax=Orchesella cincta TaxID=48709 RepID=A0A1D2MBD2_ORCCI|nr:hypothetical protein Ocin01_16442 [Orchesella cincta]